MYERTRRNLCIVGFFTLCVAPTLGTVLFCAARHWPGHQAAEAARLGRQLGVTASFASYEYLRPGVVRYHGLTLADPETGEKLLRCATLEAAWETGQDDQGERRAVLNLTAATPELSAAALGRLWRLPAALLARQAADCDVRLAAAELSLVGDNGRHELLDVQAAIENFSAGSQAQACFRLRGLQMTEPARARVVRNRQIHPPTNAFEIDTRGAALPCSLMALAVEPMGNLGPQSRFRGYLWANGEGDELSGELTGQLFNVDLGSLVDKHLPYRFSGTAEIAVQAARFRGRRLDEAVVAVTAGPGLISRGLCEAAVEHLKLSRAAAPQVRGDLVDYRQLAVTAVLDQTGLRLHGRCDAAAAGTVLADDRGALLAEPMVQPQPVAALIQTLAPGAETTLPMTREADWLSQRLPAPRPSLISRSARASDPAASQPQ